MSALLDMRDLSLFIGSETPACILNGVSLTVDRGDSVALVGESGSGKSMTLKSILRLFPKDSSTTGDVLFDGESVLALDAAQLAEHRSRRVAMVFQDPRASINPVRTIGDFLVEGLRTSKALDRTAAASEAERLLDLVGISHARERLSQFPHELSGGMLQRVMIAGAVGSGAELLLADEPTTALDVTIQAEIMLLLADLKKQLGLAVIFVTHDIDLALATSSRIDVMYAGQIVESRTSHELQKNPRHPYTAGLIGSKPSVSRRVHELAVVPGQPAPAKDSLVKCGFASRCTFARAQCGEASPSLTTVEGGHVRCVRAAEIRDDLSLLIRPHEEELKPNTSDHNIVSVKGLKKSFSIRKSRSIVKAVDDVSFTIGKGECLGIVGESGSGKSTVARLLLGIETLDAGEITVCGEPRKRKAKNWKQRKQWGSQLQIVFQDPYSSLDPRQTPLSAITEVIKLHFPQTAQHELAERAQNLLMSVGIHEELQHSLPAELSGGQQQRVAIAKALAPEPEVIVLDEAVSGLDVSIQAQVLNLLSELQRTTDVSFLFISHDLAVIRQLCHRVIVMHHGKIVEQGGTRDVLANPAEDYTKKLIASAPRSSWELNSGGL